MRTKRERQIIMAFAVAISLIGIILPVCYMVYDIQNHRLQKRQIEPELEAGIWFSSSTALLKCKGDACILSTSAPGPYYEEITFSRSEREVTEVRYRPDVDRIVAMIGSENAAKMFDGMLYSVLRLGEPSLPKMEVVSDPNLPTLPKGCRWQISFVAANHRILREQNERIRELIRRENPELSRLLFLH